MNIKSHSYFGENSNSTNLNTLSLSPEPTNLLMLIFEIFWYFLLKDIKKYLDFFSSNLDG